MTVATQIAQHLREVFFGGNWTDVAMKETLADVSWQQASKKCHNLNTIAALVFHTHYYVKAAIPVLKGEPLNASDKLSFNLPPIQDATGWEKLVGDAFADAERLAAATAQLDDATLFGNFADGTYGTVYRNLTGVIEHTHYHLGQIVLIKKLLQVPDAC